MLDNSRIYGDRMYCGDWTYWGDMDPLSVLPALPVTIALSVILVGLTAAFRSLTAREPRIPALYDDQPGLWRWSAL